MLDQSFSSRSLLRLVEREDVARFRLWRPGDDRNSIMRGIAEAINMPDFTFPTFREKSMNGKAFYSAPDATTMFALRQLDRNIRAIYKVKQNNRDELVHQVKSLLMESCPFTVLRLDIRSFYESIDRESVISRIERDSILSYTSRKLLRKLFEAPQLACRTGVPRGLGVSATLAEFFARSIDRLIRDLRHVYYYGRYVDDIVVFTHASAAIAEAEIRSVLARFNMKVHPDKKDVVTCVGKNRANREFGGFEFLGYHLACRLSVDDEKTLREVSVKIASSKVKKLKSRVAHAFIDYAAAPDYALLTRRLRFLAGNYVLRDKRDGGLCGGIYFNYHHISDMSDLVELDVFLRRLIFARRGSIGRRLSISLSDVQRQHLARIGFRAAFERRILRPLRWGAMAELRKCWAYEKN